jgi:hypothetical protein
MLLEAFRRHLNEHHRTFAVFLTQVKMAVSAHQASLAQLLPVLPLGLASLEVLARPSFPIRIAVNKFAHLDDTAMVVAHDLVCINLLRAELTAFYVDFEKIAAGSIA